MEVYRDGKPKYKELEKRFNEDMLIDDLESKKQKLKLIRELYKPLDPNDFKQHQAKLSEVQRQKEEVRTQRLQAVKSESRIIQTKLGNLRSKVMETVIESQKIEREESLAKEKAVKDNVVKMNLYAKQVNGMNVSRVV